MSTKVCKKCNKEKDLNEFYAHPETADKHEQLCKQCRKTYAKEYAHTDAGKASERKRNQKPARKLHLSNNSKAWRIANPEKALCHSRLWHAIARGKIVRPDHCSRCGKEGRIHAHHKDYGKPFEVEWLCVECHGTENPSFIPF